MESVSADVHQHSGVWVLISHKTRLINTGNTSSRLTPAEDCPWSRTADACFADLLPIHQRPRHRFLEENVFAHELCAPLQWLSTDGLDLHSISVDSADSVDLRMSSVHLPDVPTLHICCIYERWASCVNAYSRLVGEGRKSYYHGWIKRQDFHSCFHNHFTLPWRQSPTSFASYPNSHDQMLNLNVKYK